MSGFRTFVWEKWQEHKEELLAWEKSLPQYDSNYYYHKHKWFLKNMYKESKKVVDKPTE